MVVERSINLRIEDAKESIFKEMVNAKLPATILQLILVDIKQQIDMETSQILNKEREEYQKSVTEVLQKNEATQ